MVMQLSFTTCSVKSKRETWSYLSAEVFAAVHAFYFACTRRENLNNIFSCIVPLILYTESNSLFDSFLALDSTTENRLSIYLFMLRQIYELRELTEVAEVVWIPRAQNPADAMTKQNSSNTLLSLLKMNNISGDGKIWIQRPESTKCKSIRCVKTPCCTILARLLPFDP